MKLSNTSVLIFPGPSYFGPSIYPTVPLRHNIILQLIIFPCFALFLFFSVEMFYRVNIASIFGESVSSGGWPGFKVAPDYKVDSGLTVHIHGRHGPSLSRGPTPEMSVFKDFGGNDGGYLAPWCYPRLRKALRRRRHYAAVYMLTLASRVYTCYAASMAARQVVDHSSDCWHRCGRYSCSPFPR